MAQPNLQTEQKPHLTTFLDKLLGRVEAFGNKLPDPFILFVCLALIIVLASVAINSMGVTVVHPGTNKTLPIKSLLSHEGIQYILTSMLTNFTEFKP
jgi:aminobenzoyl-glutamate transport protein